MRPLSTFCLVVLFAFGALPLPLTKSQSNNAQAQHSIDDDLQEITTLVESSGPGGKLQGTGFFYYQFGPSTKSNEPHWVPIEKMWLVTNRHIIAPKIKAKEMLATSFTFSVRRIDGDALHWEPITLSRDEIIRRARFDRDNTVDVFALDVLDLLTRKIELGIPLAQWVAVSKENFAGQNKISVNVGDDLLVIGYPRGFYDEVNLFPIVKSGIIASKWGASFNGKRYFLIDAKLFPGSSGSLVVSKPRNLVIEEGKQYFSETKQYAFLGILSGEPADLNLSIVWYADVVEGIINHGVDYSGHDLPRH